MLAKRQKTDASAAATAQSASGSCTSTGTAPHVRLFAATAGHKGRKHTMEDVTVLCDWLDRPDGEVASSLAAPAARLALYAILDGHGGRLSAEWIAEHLPAMLRSELTHNAPTSANKDSSANQGSSAETKRAIVRAFTACDAELMTVSAANGWHDGCCAIALIVDTRCFPARCYVANLGDSRGFVGVREELGEGVGVEAGIGVQRDSKAPVVTPEPSLPAATLAAATPAAATPATGHTVPPMRAVSLSKQDHSVLVPSERRRVEAAGGWIDSGRLCGSLEVSRAFGDPRLKTRGLIATPELVSFAVGAAQRFVLLGCDGLWKVFSGEEAVRWLDARLPQMDASRANLAQKLGDARQVTTSLTTSLTTPFFSCATLPVFAPLITHQSFSRALAALKKDAREELIRAREDASETALLRKLLSEAVNVRNAKDNCTALLVRFQRPDTCMDGDRPQISGAS